MRPETLALTVLILSAAAPSTSASAYDMPYDPYPWCAVYGGDFGGASNCGFLTLGQCRATVSGIGGSCEPNQFYNPRGGAGRHNRKPPR